MLLINQSDEVLNLCNTLKSEKFICVDTEFIREKYYYPKLCLIQLGDSKGNGWAIDPLVKNIDLQPIYELFLNENILKIFHSPRQDFEIIFNILNKIPKPIFDTQSAAMACGFGDSASYESLVNNIVKVNLDKSARFTDWQLRPLSKKQIDYAISDVTHLSAVYNYLLEDMIKKGRVDWIKEEVHKFFDLSIYVTEPNDAWKRIKFFSPDKITMSIFREVSKVREELAKNLNVPRNKIMRDDIIIKLAKNPPKDLVEFDGLRGMNLKNMNSSHKNFILKSIETGKNSNNTDWLNNNVKSNNPSKAVTDILKIILLSCAEKYNISPLLIANKEDIKQIAQGKKDIKALKGWRYEIFGSSALKLIEGSLKIIVKEGAVIIE
ncbi:ribonuclease D [Alphaproteobacteria bacterium]|nr:ribonuclease D [Alphaproteobacteria bacterium]